VKERRFNGKNILPVRLVEGLEFEVPGGDGRGGDRGEEFDFAIATIAVKEERSKFSIPRSVYMVATPLFSVNRLGTYSSCCSAVLFSAH
jgi:hypothetical protein